MKRLILAIVLAIVAAYIAWQLSKPGAISETVYTLF